MKNLVTFLFFPCLLIFLASCKEENNEQLNFYNTEYRKGLWISLDKKDILDFIDGSNLIRKCDYYSNEEYLYRIEGETLFIKLPDSSFETQHPILIVDKNRIIIGNMYITTGFSDNSGTFIKK